MSDLSFAELSKITGTHVVTLRRLALANKLPGAYRLGGKWLFRSESVPSLRGVLGEQSTRQESSSQSQSISPVAAHRKIDKPKNPAGKPSMGGAL